MFKTSTEKILPVDMILKIPKIKTRNEYWNKRFLQGVIYGKKSSMLASFVLKYLKKFKPQKILVVGGGYGRNAAFFAKNGFFVINADISANALNLGKKIFCNLSNLIFLKDDILKSKIKRHSFDSVVCLYSMSLFSDNEIKTALNTIKKILKPDGLFICNFLSKKDDEYKLGTKINENILLSDDKKQLVNFYDRKRVANLLKLIGFKILKINEVSEKRFINIFHKEFNSNSWFVVSQKPIRK